MEYELVKSVSIKALIQAQGDVKCEEFWKELAAFCDYIDMQGGNLHLAWDYWETAKDYIKDHPKAAAYLKEKGFIRVKERTYTRGQCFDWNGTKCVLSIIGNGYAMNLIMYEGWDKGNRVGTTVRVADPRKVTQSELDQIVNGAKLIIEQ